MKVLIIGGTGNISTAIARFLIERGGDVTLYVYTKPAKHYPIRADEERQPSSSFPYAVNKAWCENILLQAHQRSDFPLTIIRPAMIVDIEDNNLCYNLIEEKVSNLYREGN